MGLLEQFRILGFDTYKGLTDIITNYVGNPCQICCDYSPKECVCIRVFAINYNILKIMGGLEGLTYST